MCFGYVKLEMGVFLFVYKYPHTSEHNEGPAIWVQTVHSRSAVAVGSAFPSYCSGARGLRASQEISHTTISSCRSQK